MSVDEGHGGGVTRVHRTTGWGPANAITAVRAVLTVVLATMAGRLRRNRIKIMNGDRVSLELSPYDLTKGRITYRHK